MKCKHNPLDWYELVDGKIFYKHKKRLAPAHMQQDGYWRYSPKAGITFSANTVLRALTGSHGKLDWSAPYPELKYWRPSDKLCRGQRNRTFC